MHKPHRQATYASKKAINGRTHKNKCEECNKICCSEHLYKYTDDTNANINYNSPYLCNTCYEKNYNEKIKTNTEVLINQILTDYKFFQKYGNTFDMSDPEIFYKFITSYKDKF